MNPDLLRLKLAILVSLALSVCFGWFVIQRVYYYYKTLPIDSVESVKAKIFPDWVLGIAALFLLWFGVAGLMVVGKLDGFSSLGASQVLCELEVAASGSQGFTLLAFDRIDQEAPDSARRRGVLVSAGTDFEVEVQRVGFGTLLPLLGQGEMVRVVRVTSTGVRRRGTQTPVSQDSGLEVGLSSSVDGSLAYWPFMPKVETLLLGTEATTQGAIFSVEIGKDGQISLVQKRVE